MAESIPPMVLTRTTVKINTKNATCANGSAINQNADARPEKIRLSDSLRNNAFHTERVIEKELLRVSMMQALTALESYTLHAACEDLKF
jgi:hypothetical protein